MKRGLVLLLAIACTKGEGPRSQGKTGGSATLPTVETAEVERRDMPVQLFAVGQVEPPETVQVKSLVAGAIVAVRLREGQDVIEGQVLFEIDRRPFEAALAQAKALVRRDRAQAASARKLADRYGQLVEKGYVTAQQAEDARAQAAAFEAAAQADAAQVQAAELNLGYCTIRAPISGRTGSLLVDVGNLVKVNDVPLVVINQVHPILVTFTVPGRELLPVQGRLRRGAPAVSAHPPGSPRLPSSGELVFVDNTADAATGSVSLKARFANADDALWPGLLVDVVVTLERQPEAIVVPSAAILAGQRGSWAFVVDEDGTARARDVRVERRVGEIVVVREGLTEGEHVVTDGQLGLVEGMKVNVRDRPGRKAIQGSRGAP